MSDTIPTELLACDQWVTWNYVDGSKVPFNPRTGHRASSTNDNTWTSYETAAAAAQARNHAGVGFVFHADDPYAGIDLDDCIVDGALLPWAADIVQTMDSYTEISPSGTGLKIWVQGTVPRAVKTAQIEIYDRARYFTVTGQHYDSTPTTIRYVNGALSALYESLQKPAPAPTAQYTTQGANSAYLYEWAKRKLADAIHIVAMAVDGTKHDTLLDAARLAGGAAQYLNDSEIETALYAAVAGRAHDKHGAMKTIRDGIAMGRSAPLMPPEPPAQPIFNGYGVACCSTHRAPLVAAKNGNGFRCNQKDASTPRGWCDFWWKGEGYAIPALMTTVPNDVSSAQIAEQDYVPRAISPPANDAVSARRYVLYRLEGLRALPPVSWLISNEVPAHGFTVICGPSGAGKSFLAVEYAMLIARAFPAETVVYIAPEGGSGYHKRVDAWIAQYGGDAPDNLAFLLQPVPLIDGFAVGEFVATIVDLAPSIVFVDTLARCMVGGDENSAKDMGLFVNGVDTIRRATNAAVAVVHHSGKAGTGYRGSSALFGAADSWIDIVNDDGLITVSCGKAKDWQPFSPRYLRMVERADSMVLVPSDQVSQRSLKLTEGQRKTLETLALDIFTGPGAKRNELVAATGIPDATMYKILSRLKRDNYIGQGSKGDPYRITPVGLSAIKAYHRALRQQRAELSPLSPTITPLSDSDSHQLSTISLPPLGGEEIVDSEVGSEESELFDDDEPTEETAVGFRAIPGYEAPQTESAVPAASAMLARLRARQNGGGE